MINVENPKGMLKETNGKYADERGNQWSKERFSYEEALRHSYEMSSCFDCTDCIKCQFCIGCEECENCTWCGYCKSCHECSGCEGQIGKSHKMFGPPGSFFYRSAITKEIFGYYWDDNNNIWDKKLFTFSQANRIAENTNRCGSRNVGFESETLKDSPDDRKYRLRIAQ